MRTPVIITDFNDLQQDEHWSVFLGLATMHEGHKAKMRTHLFNGNRMTTFTVVDDDELVDKIEALIAAHGKV